MAMDGNATGAPRFAIGIVISTSLRVIAANVLRFLGIILAIGVPAVVLIALAIVFMAEGAPTSSGSGLNFTLKGGAGLQILFIIFVALVGVGFYVLIQTSITYGTLQTLRGRKATIRDCIANALSAAPRVFLASLILFAISAIVGLVAVQMFRVVALGGGQVVGAVGAVGFIAVLAFILVLVWVFVPAIVVERVGPVACFTRSMALTKGHRWGILGLLVLVVVANWLATLLSQTLPRIGAPAAGAVLNIVSALFFIALGAVLSAVGYYALRAEKEGIAIEDVVKVFD